jgi:hypothetical protein
MGGYAELQTVTYHIVWILIAILWLPAKNTNPTFIPQACRILDAFRYPACTSMHTDKSAE